MLTNIVSPIIFPSADQEITAPRVVTDERDTASNLREQQEGVEDEWGNRYMHGFQARRHQLQARDVGIQGSASFRPIPRRESPA